MSDGAQHDVAVGHQPDELLSVADGDDAGVDLFHELRRRGQRVIGGKGADSAGHGL
jgi:hypothetical protein